MLLRAMAIWFVLLVAAVLNGGFREAVLLPKLGTGAAHVVSTLMLSTLIVLLAWLTVPWVAPLTASDALRVGAIWVTFTLAFEFLAGHYLFDQSWSDLLADYNVARGRIWPLVLAVTFLAPWLAFRFSAAR